MTKRFGKRGLAWSRLRRLALALLSAALIVPSARAEASSVSGAVKSLAIPLSSFNVKLYQTSGAANSPATLLGQTVSNALGEFEISFIEPSNPDSVLYLVARRGRSVLATVLGPAPLDISSVIINERTTVAAGFTLAQFITGENISGNAVGVRNAAAMLRNLVDVGTADLASVLGGPTNGENTLTLPTFNALANMVATCVRDQNSCRSLFKAAQPPRGAPPRQTLQAIVNIARNPWKNVSSLFDYAASGQQVYLPTLNEAPNAWILALRFTGEPMTMNGPGNFAIDADGNLWVTDNYQWAPRDGNACAGQLLLKFTPTGAFFPGSPYSGGGLDGAGFGITLDTDGNVWVANFGFQAPACIGTPEEASHDSVSEFLPDGTALSPDEIGFTEGNISWPQGIVSDQDGNIWIANCGNNSVTVYPSGEPLLAQNYDFTPAGLTKPFDIAIGPDGAAWVTFNGGDAVAIMSLDGQQFSVRTIPNKNASDPAKARFNQPMGIASDSKGNMWVSNSGLLDVPCPDGGTIPPGERGGSVMLIYANGRVAPHIPFTGGGIAVPWGVAVDGHDNVWVANFGGGTDEGGSLLSRLSQLCGTDQRNCPPGLRTGDPISPITGYTSDALDRVTGLAIDPSGNVWAVDNWKFAAQQNNPAGEAIVAFLGLAGPLQTPLIGPPVPAQ